MKLLVGLGNPPEEYETTRHNAGALILDFLAEEFRIRWEGRKFLGEWAKGQVLGESCLLLKPMTYMNLSGRSVTQCLNFYKLSPSDLIVFHDDVDVPAGKVKARTGGSDGGHKGIRSIIELLGGEQGFHRIKLGVGKPPAEQPGRDTADWVLGRMTDEELRTLDEVMFPEAMRRLEGIFKQGKAEGQS